MIEALICDHCGGAINPRTYQCEYCGTRFINPKSGSVKNNGVIIIGDVNNVQIQQGVINSNQCMDADGSFGPQCWPKFGNQNNCRN